jgi:hypothetical protein
MCFNFIHDDRLVQCLAADSMLGGDNESVVPLTAESEADRKAVKSLRGSDIVEKKLAEVPGTVELKRRGAVRMASQVEE